jgi:hypothetical protein
MSQREILSPATSSATAGKGQPPRRSLAKTILFRLAAVVLGLSPLILLETACHLFGWGQPAYLDDPYVGFSSINPLFVHNNDTDNYETAPSRLKFFCKESFPAQKPANQYRIFVLGGSTVKGNPYEKETAFSTWLELSLKAAEPERDWRVINCGGISYASYRLVPILEEALQRDADMIIVCTGHNEFLEDRTYSHIKNTPAVISWPVERIAGLRTYNLLRGGYLAMTDQVGTTSPDRPVLGPEADARLDFKGGMDQYHRDENWRQGVIDHFEYNLKRIAYLTKKADVPLIFVGPVSNLDWKPFKSQHRDDLSQVDREQFDSLMQQHHDTPSDDVDTRIALLKQARAIDDRHALLHYELGQRYQDGKMFALARKSFEQAIEEDICPLRMLAPMRDKMMGVAGSAHAPLVDAHELVTARSLHGITDKEWMEDHVHPRIDGHKLLAQELLAIMQNQKIVHPRPGWEAVRDQSYVQHVATLPVLYFENGQRHLIGLTNWAYGKVPTPRPKTNTTP